MGLERYSGEGAKTRRVGGREMGEEGDVEEVGKRSKDGKRNKEGKRLVEFMKQRRWFILNGGIEEDEEREWMYTVAKENR